jgi:hypothetical protein
LQAGGIKIGDNKYMFLTQVGDSFYGKKGVRISTQLRPFRTWLIRIACAAFQADGVCVSKTKQAILIGEYKEGTTAVEANEVVEKMATYLSEQGF